METSDSENPSVLSAQQPPLEPDSHSEEDEGFAEGSDTASYISTIASDIKRGREENGRLYPAYGTHEYGMPVDEDELDRMDMQHHKYFLLLGERLFLAPIAPNTQRILDMGTGTGIWAIDIADAYPAATVTGVDIAAVQPPFVPPNCTFEIDDLEDEWKFSENSFDFIHARDLYLSIRDWPRLVSQCFDHLKPGGWLELQCVFPVPQSDDGTLPADSAYVEVCDTFQKIGERMAADPDAVLRYKDYLHECGFRHVRQVPYQIPTSPWPRHAVLKKIGALELCNLIDGAQGFLLRGYTREFGKTREELELLIYQMRRELMSKKFHSYIPFYVVYGQKPPSKEEQA